MLQSTTATTAGCLLRAALIGVVGALVPLLMGTLDGARRLAARLPDRRLTRRRSESVL